MMVVRPPGAATGLLLARADGADQAAAVGRQFAGRVGFFLQVEDFEAVGARMIAAGVRFVTEPEPSPTAGSPSSSTSPGTAGTCSAPPDILGELEIPETGPSRPLIHSRSWKPAPPAP